MRSHDRRSVLRIGGSAVAGVAVAALAAAPPAGTVPAADVAQLRTELWAAIGAEGDTYREFRDRLLARGEAIRSYLEEVGAQGKTWQEKVMAAILVERLTNAAEIGRVVEWWGRARFDRMFSENWLHLGKSLAERAAQTPMLLVEKIWKGNELRHPAFVSRLQDGAWEADALGWLGEKRALYPLMSVLTRRYEDPAATLCVETAARALGNLKDQSALPALCETYILYASQRAGSVCFEAIQSCAGRGSSNLLRYYADRTGSGGVRDELNHIADMLDKKGPVQK